MSTSLRDRQRDMQRAILTGTNAAPFAHGAHAEERSERLHIYAAAYRLRLHEALAENYPALRTLVGAPEFTTLASRYLDAHPSRHFSVRAFGAALPDWLVTERPHEPWLAELARLEWRLGCAFDAPDEPVLTIAALAAIEPHRWSGLRFRFAPSVARLDLHTNAPELYAHIMQEEAPPAGEARAKPACWLIWRQQLSSRYRSMKGHEALAFDTLAAGETFGATCQRLLTIDTEQDVPLKAAECLKRWISDELVVTFSIAAA